MSIALNLKFTSPYFGLSSHSEMKLRGLYPALGVKSGFSEHMWSDRPVYHAVAPPITSLHIARISFDDGAVVEFPFEAGAIGAFALQRLLSRGFISLNTTSPESPPLVYYRTFSNPLDVSLAISALRYSRKLNDQRAVAGFAPVELAPGNNVTDDAALEAFLRDRAMAPTFGHASGSTSMLPEALGGVVGPDLRVYGTRRLSVVDAGIMPFIPATHLCTTV
ncbi:unnamed protein product [Periconia digitata]|uniref:Glucose-methanol-choline oxidoreductase C-terminal domain-containing protein n=1 Tax=Periconia digitata TaxID=1303443 RepID=A0A9W4XYL9_9PLEO|nr:unnamed protein product [Periconia digitata]